MRGLVMMRVLLDQDVFDLGTSTDVLVEAVAELALVVHDVLPLERAFFRGCDVVFAEEMSVGLHAVTLVVVILDELDAAELGSHLEDAFERRFAVERTSLLAVFDSVRE